MWSLTWCEVCQDEIPFSCFLLGFGLLHCLPWLLHCSPGFVKGEDFPFGRAWGPWEEGVLTALQHSPVKTHSQFGLRERFLPF